MQARVDAPDMESLLERTTKSLGLAAACLLIVSIGYDYAYVRALGLSFAALPTSLSDHVRTAVVWAPVTGVGLVGGFLLGMLNSPSTDTQTAPSARALFWLWALNIVGALIALMLTAAGFELVVILMATVLVILARPHARPDSPLVNRFGPAVSVSLVVFPLVILITTYFGHVQGTALFTGSPRFTIEAKLESGPLRISDVGLRRFSTFTVAVDRNQTVHVLPDSAIQRVQVTVQPPQPWRCAFIPYGCPQPPGSKPSQALPNASTASAQSASSSPTTGASSAAVTSSQSAPSAPKVRSGP